MAKRGKTEGSGLPHRMAGVMCSLAQETQGQLGPFSLPSAPETGNYAQMTLPLAGESGSPLPLDPTSLTTPIALTASPHLWK